MKAKRESFLPDQVAGWTLFVGSTALIGYEIWGTWAAIAWQHPIPYPDSSFFTRYLVSGSLRFAVRLWIAYGVFQGRRWALISLAFLAAYTFSSFTGNNLFAGGWHPKADETLFIVSRIVGLFWCGLLVFGVGRLFRLFGPSPIADVLRPRFSLDRFAGTIMIVGNVALRAWTFGPIFFSAPSYHISNITVMGALVTTVIEAATSVWYGIGVFRSQPWALVLSALIGATGAMGLLGNVKDLSFRAHYAFSMAIFLYGGLRLFALIPPPRYGDEATPP